MKIIPITKEIFDKYRENRELVISVLPEDIKIDDDIRYSEGMFRYFLQKRKNVIFGLDMGMKIYFYPKGKPKPNLGKTRLDLDYTGWTFTPRILNDLTLPDKFFENNYRLYRHSLTEEIKPGVWCLENSLIGFKELIYVKRFAEYVDFGDQRSFFTYERKESKFPEEWYNDNLTGIYLDIIDKITKNNDKTKAKGTGI